MSEQTFDFVEIQNILPHRYPFLFLDRVLDHRPGEYCKALKNISGNEQYLQGHFPGKPVVPGVILIEAMAQAGGVIIYHILKKEDGEADKSDKTIFFGGINKSRFKTPVLPGDQVIFEVTLKKHKLDLWIFDGTASVDGQVVADAEIKVVVR